MQETNNNNQESGNEINLVNLFLIVFKGKMIIIFFTIIFSIISVFYSLSLPNIFQSKAVLVPVEAQDHLSSAIRSYGGLASLAGVNLASNNSENNSMKAIEKLESLSFFENNILPNIFLPELMAVKSWNSKTNKINFDEELYDKKNQKWVREFTYPKKPEPSAQESFLRFHGQHFTISEDKMTGFITVRVKHQSPYVAKSWSELLINEINRYYRDKDKNEAEKAVSYLNKQISKANLTEIKQSISELLKAEINKLTLIEVTESYVFEFIDPPAVMERKSEPSRSLITILGTIIGGIFGVLIVFIRHFITINKDI